MIELGVGMCVCIAMSWLYKSTICTLEVDSHFERVKKNNLHGSPHTIESSSDFCT